MLLVGALIAITFSVQGSRMGRDWVVSRLSAYDGGYTAEECEKDIVASFNLVRKQSSLSELKTDPDLMAWLKTTGKKIAVSNTKELLKQIQESDLNYTETYVVAAEAVSKRALVHQFDEAARKSNPRYESIGATVRPRRDGYGYEVLLVIGRKLQEFQPELVNSRDINDFIAHCPHCKQRYMLRAQSRNGGMYLSCPKCGMSGGILATDSLGSYRWGNEFLVGYQPPAVFPADITREHEMFIVWNAVNSDCIYRTDSNEPGESRDAWQMGLETMVRGQGDCEDTSILLTDWLIARGFNARMAIGTIRGGGHAWCVVRLDGVEYLLESTNANPDMNHLPYVERVGAGYEPHTLIDRDYIYVLAKGVQRFKGRYYSDDWVAFKPRPRKDLATPQKLAAADQPASGPRQISLRLPEGESPKSTSVRLPELKRLADVASGNDDWQLVTPFATSHPEASGK